MIENFYDNPIGTKVHLKMGGVENDAYLDTTTIYTITEHRPYDEVKDITGHFICKCEETGETREVRDWDVVAIPDRSLPEDEMLYKYLAANGVYADVYKYGNSINVAIEWGDWKHSHGLCSVLMAYLGYIKVEEEVTEEDGSDCYSATHTYEYSPITMAVIRERLAELRQKAKQQ